MRPVGIYSRLFQAKAFRGTGILFRWADIPSGQSGFALNRKPKYFRSSSLFGLAGNSSSCQLAVLPGETAPQQTRAPKCGQLLNGAK